MTLFLACAITLAVAPGSWLTAQVQTNVPDVVPGAKPVTVEHIKVHGTALEGNLDGDAVDRDVIVFLPPGYRKDKKRRCPVVYALHGYSIGAEQWTHEIQVPQTIQGTFTLGSQEMIVVLPDSKTIYTGSMYSSSVTTGDFERFIYHDVVAYIDAHYRTIPDRAEPRSRRPTSWAAMVRLASPFRHSPSTADDRSSSLTIGSRQGSFPRNDRTPRIPRRPGRRRTWHRLGFDQRSQLENRLRRPGS